MLQAGRMRLFFEALSRRTQRREPLSGPCEQRIICRRVGPQPNQRAGQPVGANRINLPAIGDGPLRRQRRAKIAKRRGIALVVVEDSRAAIERRNIFRQGERARGWLAGLRESRQRHKRQQDQ